MMKLKWVMIALVLAGAVVVLAKLYFFPAPSGWLPLTPAELHSRMQSGDKLVIVDIREKELYYAGHIPGAIWIPYTEVRQRMAQLNPRDTIVFVCHMGPMGQASAQLLFENGYQSVYNLVGGMAAWRGKTETAAP